MQLIRAMERRALFAGAVELKVRLRSMKFALKDRHSSCFMPAVHMLLTGHQLLRAGSPDNGLAQSLGT